MNLTPLALAGALALAPFAVQAATVQYSASGSGSFEGNPQNTAAAFASDDDSAFDITVFAFTFDGVFEADLDVSVSGTQLLTGIGETAPTFASGETGFRTATVVFNVTGGDDRGLFGDFATAIFTFASDDVDSGEFDPVTVEILSDLPPIPLPASLPMLLAGLGLFAGVRRLRA